MEFSSRQAAKLLARRAADTYERSLALRRQASSIAGARCDSQRQGLGSETLFRASAGGLRIDSLALREASSEVATKTQN